VTVGKNAHLRQFALFGVMLMSGGWMLFPRLPLLVLVVIIYLLLCGRRLVIDRRHVPVLSILTAIFLVSLLRDSGGGIGALIIRFVNFVAGALVFDLYARAGAEAFRADVYRISRLMAWQALFTVFLAIIAPGLFLPIDVDGVVYHSFLLIANYHSNYEDIGLFVRPDGFFYEPGVFQIYLNLFLYLTLFVYRRLGHATLALAAVMSTQSTTGVVIALMLCGAFAFTSYMNRASLGVRAIRILIAVVLLVPLVAVVSQNVADKVVGEMRGSFWSRQYDLLTGVNVIGENPMIGIGFEYEDYYRAASRLGYSDTQLGDHITIDRGNTNGIVFLLYSVGIPLALPFLIGIFRQKLLGHGFLVGTLIFLSLLSESVIFTPFFLAIIFSGMVVMGTGVSSAGVVRMRRV
jgi:hypothetical protein